MASEKHSISPIARIYTDFPDKFGVPRQSGLAGALTGRVVLEPEFRKEEALREIESFSHLWLIWHFSECAGDGSFKPTVRPPRLGGNRRVGVFASRSPFRPNGLGLSCVELLRIDRESSDAPALVVSGVDMLSGTPIFDIKPYIPVSDCKPDAAQGYTSQTRSHALRVEAPSALLEPLSPEKRAGLIEALSLDPRPGYSVEPLREYGMLFAGYDWRFRVDGDVLTVLGADKL